MTIITKEDKRMMYAIAKRQMMTSTYIMEALSADLDEMEEAQNPDITATPTEKMTLEDFELLPKITAERKSTFSESSKDSSISTIEPPPTTNQPTCSITSPAPPPPPHPSSKPQTQLPNMCLYHLSMNSQKFPSVNSILN